MCCAVRTWSDNGAATPISSGRMLLSECKKGLIAEALTLTFRKSKAEIFELKL